MTAIAACFFQAICMDVEAACDLTPRPLAPRSVAFLRTTVSTLIASVWVTFEESHVDEYKDPAIVGRAPAGQQMLQVLLDGSSTQPFLVVRFQIFG
jgi:hypothetical protein